MTEAKQRGRELEQEFETLLAGSGTSLAELKQAYTLSARDPRVRAFAQALTTRHPAASEFIGPDGLLKPADLAMQAPARLATEPDLQSTARIHLRRFGRFI